MAGRVSDSRAVAVTTASRIEVRLKKQKVGDFSLRSSKFQRRLRDNADIEKPPQGGFFLACRLRTLMFAKDAATSPAQADTSACRTLLPACGAAMRGSAQ